MADAIRERRRLGDLDGAWDDIVALLRIGRQPTVPPLASWALGSLLVEQLALGQAMQWALDERQTPARLRAALAEFLGLAAPPDPVLVIAAEQVVAEQTLDLPRGELRDAMANLFTESQFHSPETVLAMAGVITTPWEVSRARRAFRTLHEVDRVRASRPYAATGPVFRTSGTAWSSSIIETTPLVRWLLAPTDSYLATDDRAEVDRRALAQILALRAWQLDHDGRLPDRLEDLVPSELDRLPDDPFRPARPFGYARSDGRALPPVGFLNTPPGESRPVEGTVGHRLLYSIGPDGVDQGGLIVPGPGGSFFGGDLVYPLPDGTPPAEAIGVR